MTRSPHLGADALARTARRQEGVISRSQAVSCGMTSAALRHRIRPGGPWQRLLPGVYLTVSGVATQSQRETAALLYAGPASMLTGAAALRRYGMRVPESPVVSVLVPARQSRVSRSFVHMRPTTRMPEHFCHDGAVRFAPMPRALADTARELTSFRDVRALVADAIQQGRCPLDWLSSELAQGPVRHSAWLRRAVAEVADGIRSAAEGDLRDLITAAGLPMPMFNAYLYVGRSLIAIADAWWPDALVAVEVDSREWHLSPDDWERTLRRNASLGAHGIVVLHFTPRQIRQEPTMVATAIRSALRAGAAAGKADITAIPARLTPLSGAKRIG